MNELTFQFGMLEQIRAALLSESPDESATILLAGESTHTQKKRLLVREVVTPSLSQLSDKSPVSVSISPIALAHALKRARNDRLSLVLVHSHPFSSGAVSFSQIDDAGERLVMPSLFARASKSVHASLVMGQTSQAGRIWTANSDKPKPIDRLTEVGSEVRFHGEPINDDVDDRFDRSVRAFGNAGQATLRKLHIGIVGLGGTGSIVAEQIAHLGVGQITLLDPDILETSNLNRLVGSHKSILFQPKVNVAVEMIERISPTTRVHSIQGDVTVLAEAHKLLGCDLIFGCTDSHGSRAVLNQIAYQYLIPVIDMGVRIQVTGRKVEAIGGRVQLLAPGFRCLVCGGFLDSEQVRRDLLGSASIPL